MGMSGFIRTLVIGWGAVLESSLLFPAILFRKKVGFSSPPNSSYSTYHLSSRTQYMLVHHVTFDRCSITAHHHVQVVQPLHHMFIHFTSYRHHIHTIHIFHNKECRCSDNSRRFYCIKFQYHKSSTLIPFITSQFITLVATAA